MSLTRAGRCRRTRSAPPHRPNASLRQERRRTGSARRHRHGPRPVPPPQSLLLPAASQGIATPPTSCPLRRRDGHRAVPGGGLGSPRLTSAAMTGVARPAGSFRCSPGAGSLRAPAGAVVAAESGSARLSPLRRPGAAQWWPARRRAPCESGLCLCASGSQRVLLRRQPRSRGRAAGSRSGARGGARGPGGRRGARPGPATPAPWKASLAAAAFKSQEYTWL